MKKFTHLFTVLFTAQLALIATPAVAEDQLVVFGGGPAGGTFQVVANAIQTYDPIQAIEGVNIKAQSSAGSVENLRNVNSKKVDFGTVYSGHVYLGSEGLLKNDPRKYDNVRAVGFLYGAPAQLVVRKGSGINSVTDLVDKKVGVGNAGSGAFANAELFFSHIQVGEDESLWNNIERNAMGYNDAANAFNNNQLDAFWLFTGFPAGAVIMAAQSNDIKLINLDADAQSSGFYDEYPYFDQLDIPADTYKGVDTDTPSFQDSTLWVAHKDVPEDLVYQMLSVIFAPEGLAYMVSQKKTFKDMAVSRGIDGIVTTLHPGATKFWKEKGLIEDEG